MAFVKKTWKDRLVEFPGRRLLKRISGSADSQMVVDVTRNEGTVSQGGDAFSAANMNDLEQRIADEFGEVNNNLISVTDGGQIENFHIGEDGKPYITYKVGADAVTKKLGSGNYTIVVRLTLQALGWMTAKNYGAYSRDITIKISDGEITFTPSNTGTTNSFLTLAITGDSNRVYIPWSIALISITAD